MTKKTLTALCTAGLAIVQIPPIKGKPTKSPTSKGWNKPRSPSNPSGYTNKIEDFANCEGYNFGLFHGASNTLALDLDNVALAKKIFEELTDLQLLEWLENDLRVEIKSPKANRGKLLFKVPKGSESAKLRQFKHEGQMIFELRAGNCQDVVIGQHPEGGEYQLIGNPAAIPESPTVLLDMMQNWDDWKHCLKSALGDDQTPPAIAPRKPQQDENLQGWRNPIAEFNQSYSVTDVLIRNGYEQIGKDRFIRPGSESKAPGVQICKNCKDGIERIYSHGGDVLNDGYAHDAFDCYRLLECGGVY